MKQETVCAFPVELFSVSDTGASSSKGACVCAVVALPSRPPKYSLVCYSAQQVTFCVARMSYVDGYNTSLRLLTHASSGHISFSDDADQRWSVFFADAAQQTRFLACCGVSFYALFGAPGASVFSYDVSFPSSSLRLEVGDRAHVSFTSYELTVKDNMYAVGALGEQRGDAAGGTTTSQQQQPFYVFQPSTSAAQLAQGSFGFEGSVVGMREEDVRVFVVPAGFTTRVSDSLANVSAQGLVFVVRLAQVEHVDEEPASARQAADNGQRAPPSVYAATEDGDARQASAPSEQALMVVAAAPTAAGVAPATSSAASAVPAFLSTNGIPAEHMSVLRKIELGVNTAVATARDVHGVTAIFSQDWHRYIERPKPSLLSNRALLEQVQRVVEEEETAQKHLDACDSALQALEARNKELQQRIDRAVSDSQRLLEEKSRGATKAMEARLERERQLVKLKDEIRVKEQTQEDLQRRVAALRSYIDTSSEELRQLQGRFDVHEIQSKGLAERISTIQESLSEERRRSATLASKSSSTEEAICKAQAQHRLADGQLTAARGLAERERLRYLQVMEDERSHRATDADILRKDIVDALDARERQYQVDRCRLAEEQFMRGLRDGKAEGRRVAETDLLGHQDELRLNLQRAKTEVEIRKEEVRRSIESAMALRRTLGGKVTELEAQLASATRKQTNLHYKLSQWQTWCRTARDTVSQHWRALLSYATHPCTQDELLKMMEAVRTAEQSSYASDDGDEGSDGTGGPVRVDLQFQLDHWRQTRIRCIAQRQRWLWDDMLDLYTKGAFVHFDREWLHPLIEAHDATLEAVAQLYAQQHGGRALFDCCAEEAQERWSVQQQWWSTIHEIEEWLAAQRTAQENLKDEEAAAREALWKEYMDGGEAVVQLCASQLRAQVMLLHEEMQARDELVSEEQRRRRLLPDEAQQQWAASCSSALRLFEEEEEAARAGLEAEAYMSYSGLEFQCAYALRAAQQLSAQHVEQQRLLAEETAARQAVMQEASDAVERCRLAAAAVVSSAEAAAAPPIETPQEGGSPANLFSPSPMETMHSAPLPPPLAEETSASPLPSPCSSSHARSPPSPTHPVEGRTPTADESATTPQVAGVPAPSHGAADAEPPVGPAVALQHVDSSPAPPPPPAAELGFGFADPPRVAWGDHSSGSGGSNRLRDGGLTMTTDTFFSSEPPPLPPPDEADSLAQAVAAPSEQRSASTFHAVATVVAPPPPRCSSHAEFSAAPTLAITAESDDTLPPSSEVAEVDRQHMSDQRSGSSGGESTSSSLRTSSTSAVQRAGDAAALFTALPLQHDSAGREEGAAVDRDSPSSTQRRPLRAFGADSSNIGEDLSGDMSRGQGSQKSPTSVPCRARRPTTKQPAAGSATQKPKLFDSSSDSEHGE
ncbi:conserved hypothetical protein [Leishmania infantum JPCM5]|uniref:Uncharacterized protein n=2 Tax=Leishmania infantum TaxID=5671 RepID=A4I525_LEIIN|nr:conserved hypothetical protein [Leishmania infantum JPCM5]CAM69893.1 conserved hypothetical protein [Leishmania infantum JPCM5]|eukprot:XP_001466844.1 conserved hypothetical protein [Leishmania infantum JPCM5]